MTRQPPPRNSPHNDDDDDDDDDIPIDRWEPTTATGDDIEQKNTMSENGSNDNNDDENEVKRQASELIQRQRKSVDTLTHIRNCIDSLPSDELKQRLSLPDGKIIIDNFLKDPNLVDELRAETISLYENSKLATLELGSGEYGGAITGGESYVDSPRCVEFVVSLTKHLPSHVSEELNDGASEGRALTFHRSARESALALLLGGDAAVMEGEEEESATRAFEFVNSSDDDVRMVSVVYYLVPESWDESCGGGLTFQEEGEERMLAEAKANRLVVFRSDGCLHRREYWIGKEGIDYGSCIVVHLVKKQG
eukprot:CAMPEP_0172493452 /NCGR_PEP_ID=MMETSP1066-20121228/24916_1 /TAXON_ID=671091 /ORGANISM="Coscinodiscus wailesii, Strain CCMP2513" /LENGTH=307 /DNA_ID=CAMNT_0013263643 /DNA_START=47 /DNA_END=970 /DNA_ORIENTATION=+